MVKRITVGRWSNQSEQSGDLDSVLCHTLVRWIKLVESAFIARFKETNQKSRNRFLMRHHQNGLKSMSVKFVRNEAVDLVMCGLLWN